MYHLMDNGIFGMPSSPPENKRFFWDSLYPENRIIIIFCETYDCEIFPVKWAKIVEINVHTLKRTFHDSTILQ